MARHASFSAAAAAETRYLTVADLRSYLGFTTLKACRRWLERQRGGLPFVRRGASRIRLFRQSDVDRYLAAGPSRAKAAARKAQTRESAHALR
jgi:hypothetical protein